MRNLLRIGVVCGFLGMLTLNINCKGLLDHDSVFSKDSLLVADSADLPDTLVTSRTEIPVTAGKNILWCGTFQLAWNEACSLLGEDIRFVDTSADAGALNKKTFAKTDLDDASYVAMAGFVRDNIHRQITEALNEKFGPHASPSLIPEKALTPRPQDIVAYSYLFKNLEFPEAFEKLDKTLVFAGRYVASFGMGEYKPGHFKMYPQVAVLSYEGRDDFVVELNTKTENDRIILAKVEPGDTLKQTITNVLARSSASEAEQATAGDMLVIPKLNFDISKRYRELEHRTLMVNSPDIADELEILSAAQSIRFQMDEKGVRLKSESHVAIGCSAEYIPMPKHIMIFNRPFLIMLIHRNAKQPYFALWVDNPELLVSQ